MAAAVITEDMVQPLTPSALADLLAAGPVDVVDVRDPNEWESGHIAGSRLVPLERLRADPDASLDREATLVFVCAKGVRSMAAAKLADRFGYERVFNLEGGTKGWVQAGLPLAAHSLAA